MILPDYFEFKKYLSNLNIKFGNVEVLPRTNGPEIIQRDIHNRVTAYITHEYFPTEHIYKKKYKAKKINGKRVVYYDEIKRKITIKSLDAKYTTIYITEFYLNSNNEITAMLCSTENRVLSWSNIDTLYYQTKNYVFAFESGMYRCYKTIRIANKF